MPGRGMAHGMGGGGMPGMGGMPDMGAFRWDNYLKIYLKHFKLI